MGTTAERYFYKREKKLKYLRDKLVKSIIRVNGPMILEIMDHR